MVDYSDNIVITDVNVIKQSLIRLVNTEVGEVWDYRAYGLNLKQYLHYPLTDATAREIESYILGRVEKFEPNVTYIDYASEITIDYNNNAIYFKLAYQLNATGEIITLPTISLIVNQ
jgi:phage baseplate assembly protein W